MGQNIPITKAACDDVVTHYQLMNRIPVSLTWDSINHREARQRARRLLKHAGAILFSVNSHPTACDYATHADCTGKDCRHLIDILPVAPGQCVILSEYGPHSAPKCTRFDYYPVSQLRAMEVPPENGLTRQSMEHTSFSSGTRLSPGFYVTMSTTGQI